MGPEILSYFWRLKNEIVGPLSNEIWVAAFFIEVEANGSEGEKVT